MSISKHLSIPALIKPWGLSGERNHGIFMFFASYMVSPLGRQPLVSLPWERTGQAIQDPGSQPGLTYPMDGTLPDPLSWHQFPHLSSKRLEDFSSSAQLLLLSDTVSDWILIWQATGVLPQSSQASRTKQERQWLKQQVFSSGQVFRQTLNTGMSEGIERRERLTRLVSTKISYIPDKYLSAQKG